jgi:transposase-like protein
MVINRTNKATLQGKIYNNIQAKSTVFTDDFRGYLGLKGFTHKSHRYKFHQLQLY